MSNTRPARISGNIIALGMVSLLTDAATEMIYPLVPVFLTLLGSGALALGVIEGVAETTASMLKLASGIISDKLGKRKLLVVIGYGISGFIRPLTGIVVSAWQIVFVRMTDRIGKGIRTAPRDALIAASVNNRIRGKAYGLHRAMDHAGAVIGPLLAITVLIILILLFEMHDTLTILRWTFILALIPGIFALLALLFFVREKSAPAPAKAKINFSLKPFDRNFRSYLAIITLFTLGNSSDAFLLFRVQEALQHSDILNFIKNNFPLAGDMVVRFGDSQAQEQLLDIMFLPLLWAFFHIIKVLFSTRFGALSDRAGRKTVISAGWGIYMLVYLALAALDLLPQNMQLPLTFILFALYALYYALCEGPEKAFVADLVKPAWHGTAFGLFNFATGLAALPASILFGFIYTRLGAAPAFGSGALIACIAILLLKGYVKESTRPR